MNSCLDKKTMYRSLTVRKEKPGWVNFIWSSIIYLYIYDYNHQIKIKKKIIFSIFFSIYVSDLKHRYPWFDRGKSKKSNIMTHKQIQLGMYFFFSFSTSILLPLLNITFFLCANSTHNHNKCVWYRAWTWFFFSSFSYYMTWRNTQKKDDESM